MQEIEESEGGPGMDGLKDQGETFLLSSRDDVVCHSVVVQLFTTPWTIACQAPLPMGILQARILEWVAISSSRGFS